MMVRRVFFPTTILWLAAAGASATTINHSNIAGVGSLPQSTMDAIGEQTWLFTHASVGGNIIDGMIDLHSADPGRYQLHVSTAYLTAPPPAIGVAGTVYELNRGNPGWSQKFSIFDSLVRNGWHSPAVDFAMDKLCYIDPTADVNAYISTMSTLEGLYPSTTFVYTTMPLTTSADSDNVLRNQYNNAVRNYCSSNNRLLFDIADIEAYNVAGSASTFDFGGTTYQRLHDDYSADGGHLNVAGRQQVAMGWYAVAASAVVPEPSTVTLLLIGGTLLAGAVTVKKRRA
jgi:hypothetical protein